MKQTILLLFLALLGSTAQAQSNDSLVVLFLSQPGTRPAQIFTDGFESGASQFDANSDGKSDLIMRRDDPQGNLRDLVVVDAVSLDTLWRVLDVQTTLGITSNMDIWGFADLHADGSPEAIFFDSRDVRAYTLDNVLSWSFENAWPVTASTSIRLLGAADLRNTGASDLLIALLDSRQVQIWGDPHVTE